MTYTPSETGLYRVELTESFERRKFIYKPGLEITVKQVVLDEMIEAGVVGNIFPLD